MQRVFNGIFDKHFLGTVMYCLYKSPRDFVKHAQQIMFSEARSAVFACKGSILATLRTANTLVKRRDFHGNVLVAFSCF